LRQLLSQHFRATTAVTTSLQTHGADALGDSEEQESSGAPRIRIGTRTVLLAVASLALGIALLVLLFRFTGVHWSQMAALLRTADKRAFVLLCCLFGFNSYLSCEKWRLAHSALSDPDDPPLTRTTAFSLTALGVALGQILPIQVSTSMARTLGTWAEGRAFRRGTLGTLFGQAFDFLVLCVLMLATLLARLIRTNAAVWVACSLAVLLLTIAICPRITAIMRWVAARVARHTGRRRRFASELLASGLMERRLARKLTAISAARFVVLALMAESVALAIHSPIPMWHLAAAVPFGLLAAVAGITPGGLGVSEFAFTGILAGFGTPLAMSSQWAIANRLLTFAAAFFVALVATTILLLHHAMKPASQPPVLATPE
jgi:uncharacterized membrane protein YbhN (UPF0104 family)